MRRVNPTSLFASVLLMTCVVGAWAMGPGGGAMSDCQSSLVRPVNAPDAAAKGTLRIRHKGNGESFEVHALKVAPTSALQLWIEDPVGSGSFNSVAPLQGKGSFQFKVDTQQGDLLPISAVTLGDLIGRRVEIRKLDAIVLQGIVPPWELSTQAQKAKITLVKPSGVPALLIQGTLTLRCKPGKGHERMDLRAQHMTWIDGPYHVFVELGVGSGLFDDAGEVVQVGAEGGRWRCDTAKGQPLPAGANFVSELAGRLIELRRRYDGLVFLRGTIPPLE